MLEREGHRCRPSMEHRTSRTILDVDWLRWVEQKPAGASISEFDQNVRPARPRSLGWHGRPCSRESRRNTDEEVAAEIANIDAQRVVARHGDMTVFCVRRHEAPRAIFEIGYLREVTFRIVGEGTGQPFDLDRYDDHYEHLFVWHETRRRIVGAYRFGRTDEILVEHGLQGLYTHSLFQYDGQLMSLLGPSLELGRSFVRPEYQKSFAPLMLLWRALLSIVAENPKYRRFFGAASISSRYSDAARNLMASYLLCRHGDDALSRLVRPRTPWLDDLPSVAGVRTPPAPNDSVEALNGQLFALEGGCNGLPVLVRQYLRLGATVAAFNLDNDFNQALDAFMVVDLVHSPRRRLTRYMGAQQAHRFLQAQA